MRFTKDPTSPNCRLPIAWVAERYGVTIRTISRWVDDPSTGFPSPKYTRGRRYFLWEAIQAWEAENDLLHGREVGRARRRRRDA
jgi:hypothetical protein